jgi:ADP-ribose pyrophosphatase YjhB (NUDIX family)
MTTDRRFCRFNRDPDTAAFSMTEIPPEGVCLSAFVLLSPRGRPTEVLLGRMNPAAPWDHLGALDPKRVEVHARGWMLPSSHLIFREAPQEGARRILREQLGISSLALTGPQVVSEVYAPRRFPERPAHWDLEFLFRGEWPEPRPPACDAWTELRFVDTRTASRAEMARSHEDILASAGMPLTGGAAGGR